jgi:hypothetical protein
MKKDGEIRNVFRNLRATHLFIQPTKIVQLCKIFGCAVHKREAIGLRRTCMATVGRIEEIANKRVALTPSTWEALSGLKEPGKSLGDTVAELVAERQARLLERDLEVIRENAQYTPWDEAKKDLGL